MRRSLAALVAATTSLVLVAFLVPIGLLLRSAAADRATAVATMEAQSIAELVPDLAPGSLPADGRTTVFLADGRTIGAQGPRTASVELASRGESFVAETTGGREVLIGIRSSSDGAVVVRHFVPDSVLYDGVVRTWVLLACIGAGLFCVGLVLADRLGRRLVGSITALAQTAERLGRGERSARVVLSGPPEVHAVGAELNRLAERIDGLLSAARAETADLAHRLRTPLTALRLNLDGLRDTEAAARLSGNIDALSLEVDELIRTARRPHRAGSVAGTDLVAVATERFHFWSALAEDTGRRLTSSVPDEPVPVPLSPEDLAAVFDVLMDNAFRYTPDQAAIHLQVGREATVAVEDAGPGFSYPVAEGSATTGLGLDIACRTAEAAGGTMRVETSALGGARVVLELRPV